MSSEEVLLHARRAFIASGNHELAKRMAQMRRQRVQALGAGTLQDAIRILVSDLPDDESDEEAAHGLPPLPAPLPDSQTT